SRRAKVQAVVIAATVSCQRNPIWVPPMGHGRSVGSAARGGKIAGVKQFLPGAPKKPHAFERQKLPISHKPRAFRQLAVMDAIRVFDVSREDNTQVCFGV